MLGILWVFQIFSCVSSIDYVLTEKILPKKYILTITLSPQLNSFTGTVDITLHVNKRAFYESISLHASSHYLQINTIYLNKDQSCTIRYFDKTTDMLKIWCDSIISSNDVLTITYKGKFANYDMLGFYKRTYTEEGEKKTWFGTNFRPLYARRAFPCFDEPRFKAIFHLRIIYPEGYNVLANTQAIKKKKLSDHSLKTWFYPTPPISTYLINFVISKFKPLLDENDQEHNYNYNVYARASVKKYLEIVAEHGTKLINTMSKLVNIDYTALGNNQIYQVAIPKFRPNYMHNWGLITYQENILLDDQNKTLASVKQRIIQVMANEISHQWFGNSITPYWWSEIWLDEGFAKYFEYHIVSKVFNYGTVDFEMEKQFVIKCLNKALIKDTDPASIPLYPKINIETPSQILNALNTISYGKGGSIVRMMSRILGIELFQKGLTSYLKKRANNYTTTEILLNELELVSKDKIVAFASKMKSWIYRPGFPMVTAKLDKTNSEITLTQERFYIDDKTQWYIPINYKTSSNKNSALVSETWLEPYHTLKIPFKGESWIIFNWQVFGFYRMNYDVVLLDMIIVALKGKDKDHIDVINRAQLISDLHKMAETSRLPYSKLFDLIEYLNYETSYYPWYAAFNVFKYILTKLDYTSQHLLKYKILSLIDTAFKSGLNGNTDNNHINIFRNTLVQEWACNVGQKECIVYAKTTFESYKIDQSLPDYNKRYLVLCNGLRYSSNASDNYNFLLNIFKQSSSPKERKSILKALACIADKNVISVYLNEVISENSIINKRYITYVFKSVLSNGQTGFDLTLNFMKKKYFAIDKAMRGTNCIASIMTVLAYRVTNIWQIMKLKILILLYEKSRKIYKQLFHIIKLKNQWTLKYGAEIKSLLKPIMI